MKTTKIIIWLWCFVCCSMVSQAQNIDCSSGTIIDPDTYTTSLNGNYGSATGAINSQYNATAALGQQFVSTGVNQQYQVTAGFYGQFLLPPSAPLVQASEGDLPDRIQIAWQVDALSPSAEDGFNIYRDGALITHVDKEVRKYIDFNVLPGQFYTYEVAGVSQFGEGFLGSALGFMNPNGVVTGQVRTTNSNAVYGAEITLTPTLGTALAFDGDDVAIVQPNAALSSDAWTMSCWVKIGDNVGTGGLTAGLLFDYGTLTEGVNWSVGIQGGMGEPRKVTVYTSQVDFAEYIITDAPDDWHHFAAAYTGASLLFYVDGQLISSTPMPYNPDTTKTLTVGGAPFFGDYYYKGLLDEFRFFHRQLSQSEINQYMHRTVNSDADGLAAYWKFDEGIGNRSYDISANALRMDLCGAQWSSDRADVVNGAVTDASGYYKIEGINYGGGETFTATASKVSYTNYALEFNSANKDLAYLGDSILWGAQTSTIELRVSNFENSPERRTILAKRSEDGSVIDFQLDIISNVLYLIVNNQFFNNLGPITPGYHHLVFTFSADIVQYWQDGELVQDLPAPGFNPHSGSPYEWMIGATRENGLHQHFTGLIDEVAFYDTVLVVQQIQELNATGTQAQTPGLRSWFALNESSGASLEDIGIDRTGPGNIVSGTWSNVTAVAGDFPHEFLPDSRLVTLNPTGTSVDQVDFTDLSTIAVTGYVRYQGTYCYADSVEILIDGQPAVPTVVTDGDGKFVVDLEPGSSVDLSPKFKNHTFSPSKWEIRNLNAPVAGILFQDVTRRRITGQVAGGFCRHSIIPDQKQINIVIKAINECYEREVLLTHQDHADGRFMISGLPPIPLEVAVDNSHPFTDGFIKDYFDLQGGQTVDVEEEDGYIDFIYFAPPNVEIDTFAKTQCGFVHLEQYSSSATNVRVYEDYYGVHCYQDTFVLIVNDNISDRDQYDTLITDGLFRLKINAGVPRLDDPYTKTLQATAHVNGQNASAIIEAVVTGERPRATSFASTSPAFPLMILRDPPGDGSFAYIEKGETMCVNQSFERVNSMGGGTSTFISLGPEFNLGQGVGVWKEDKLKVIAQTTEFADVTKTQISATTEEVCITMNQRIETSAEDDIVGGQGGDVYLGTAMNLIFGITDVLSYSEDSCTFALDMDFMIHPAGFATTYVYSEYYIRNTLLPNLAMFPDSFATSIAAWNNILAKNEELKKQAIFDLNLSFDAGVVYEYFKKTDSLSQKSFSWDSTYTNQLLVEGGAFWQGLGGQEGISYNVVQTNNKNQAHASERSFQVGYVLSDDDPGDFFSVNIKTDKSFGTPVFETKSGTSSCPWEPETQPRDDVSLVVDKNVAINIPANDAAVFRLGLGNISQSGENRIYVLQMANGTNPDGAVVKVNGQTLTSGISYTLDFGATQEVTLTVERGPIAYSYQGLEVGWFAQCEYDRAINTGLPLDEKFYKSVKLDVEFLEPCSPVDIGSPLNGEVLSPNDGVILPIQLEDYDEDDADLQYISTQYRRANATGVWINIAQTPKDSLDPISEIIEWNTTGFADGFYELRAITTCNGVGLNPGISKVVTIQIERSAPELLGTPQPADGVLSRGDEISITFNETINCLKVFQADILGNNTIGLYNTHTGELIDAQISCLENKIVIVPMVANQFIEGQILRVQVDTIRDPAENLFVGTSWEFYVDRGAIQHDGGDLDLVMYQGEELTVTRKLINVGGNTAPYALDHVPSWIKVFPQAGSLAPGGQVDIRYVFGATLPQGRYSDTLYFENGEGDERVIVNLRVLCRPPDWSFNAQQYEQTMSFILRLNIEGEFSADEQDLVVAWIDGEIRGLQNIMYEPVLKEYIAFMTVYGREGDFDKPVDLQIWDASECLHYNKVIEEFTFVPDGVIGNADDPVVLHTNSLVQREITLVEGWNWFSFNLNFPDKSLNAALATLDDPDNDLIKDQVNFAEYFDGDWIGSLQEVGNTSMYQIRIDQPDTIRMTGRIIDPDSVTIPIVPGWNWISYLPNNAYSVDHALAGLNPGDGDVIKGQNAFAQYVAGTGWIGNLKFLEAPRGYQLRSSITGSIKYPDVSSGIQGLPDGYGLMRNGSVVDIKLDPISGYWEVDPTHYEYSSTLVGYYQVSDDNKTTELHEIGAFVDGEVRGAARSIYVEALELYLFFLTIYANDIGETVTFKLYDEMLDEVTELKESVVFEAGAHFGSVAEPMPFTTSTTGIADQVDDFGIEVFPNPFAQSTTVVINSAQSLPAQMRLVDALGQLVWHEEFEIARDFHELELHLGHVASGVYFLVLETEEGSLVRKLTKHE